MSGFISTVVIILCALPFVAFAFLSTKLNLKKEQRYKQVFLPVIALIYCVLGVIFLDKISTFLLKGIYWLIERFDFLSFLEKINWSYFSVFIVNTALIIGFILVKMILFPLIMGLGSVPALADALSGKFYYVSDEDKKNGTKNRRYLMNRFGDARRVFRAMYFAMLFLSAFLMCVTFRMTSNKLLSAPFYPAFGVIVLGEIWFFLSGKMLENKSAVSIGIDIEEECVEPNYEDLTKAYEDRYSGRILKSVFEKATENATESVDELLEKYRIEYEKTLSQEAAVMYAHFGALVKSGKVLDEAYLGQTRNILEGKSVLFFTQFYNDTTDYVFLPVVRHLMKSERILVVLGNGGCVENISEWFSRGVNSITGFESIWKIASISDADEETSVIVLDTKNIYNQKLLIEKAKLLSECTMVFVMEPNRLLGTMQMGLSCLVSILRGNENDPQYIVYDRNCDGLVDSLSHVLNKSIVQVNATSVGTAKKNTIFWKADGKPMHHKLGMNSSRYLGVGTELALVALKEKVSKVVWASSGKFPVIDMHWIAAQYYSLLCKVAKINVSQNQLDEKLKFVNDTLSIPKAKNSFIIAEDEYNNAFEVARQYSTRGIEQSFTNIISQQYWLRDYMTENIDIFRQDPKSIPTITPDYQHSASNVAYKLILRMINGEIEESEICDALDLIGEDAGNIYQSVRRLMLKYIFRVENDKKAESQMLAKIDSAVTVSTRCKINPVTLRPEKKQYYSIGNKQFVDSFMSQLKIVYYIAEDESNKDSFIDSVMYGHIYQKYLPGMLITLEGKYYEVVNVTKNNGILVRRASDHINARTYYRVLRKYTVENSALKANVGARYTHGAITVEHLEADILVDTFGYLKLSQYNDVKNAKRVELSNVESRRYGNKEYIRISLNGANEKVCTTVATLLNELFVTVFPDNYQYITAITKAENPEKIQGYIPELAGVDDGIFIIEDSLIDLGLLSSVDRYLIRFLEIICDGLIWHGEKLEAEANEGSEEGENGGAEGGEGSGEDDDGVEDDAENGKKKRKGLFGFIKRLFGRKKRKAEESEEKAEKEGEENGEEVAENATYQASYSNAVMKSSFLETSDPSDDSGIGGDDSESVRVKDGMTELDEKEEELPYSKSFYLLYGFDTVPEILDLEQTKKYLAEQGFDNNYLTHTRRAGRVRKLKWYNYHFEPGVHYCDFCGAAMEDEFYVLDDGRERCVECSRDAITSVREFKKLYQKTRREMEKIFGIKFKPKIKIKMCSAQKVAEGMGETFNPTAQFDCRTLGFAQRRNGDYDIYIENGAPRIECTKTLVHEMTHIWQYSNLPDLFVPVRDLNASEGMAVWAEVQYLLSMGLNDRAEAYIANRVRENNEYGNGLRIYLDKYPPRKGAKAPKRSPFNCKHNPLH